MREKTRLRIPTLELPDDQSGVAIHIGTDLQYGDFAVPARQHAELRPRHHHGHLDGPPCEAFEPECEADFFPERGRIVVVQDR